MMNTGLRQRWLIVLKNALRNQRIKWIRRLNIKTNTIYERIRILNVKTSKSAEFERQEEPKWNEKKLDAKENSESIGEIKSLVLL